MIQLIIKLHHDHIYILCWPSRHEFERLARGNLAASLIRFWHFVSDRQCQPRWLASSNSLVGSTARHAVHSAWPCGIYTDNVITFGSFSLTRGFWSTRRRAGFGFAGSLGGFAVELSLLRVDVQLVQDGCVLSFQPPLLPVREAFMEY